MPFRPPKPIPHPPDDLRGSTILVVDDERAWRVILETDLRMLGYRVLVAEDAEQALEEVGSGSPDLAIVDLTLPEPMDGRSLLAELRRRGSRVPVIFYSAGPAVRLGRGDHGVVGHVSKADERADLYALLPPAIRGSRRRSSQDR